MVDFGIDALWLSHEPWVVPEPFTPEAGEMWSKEDIDYWIDVLAHVCDEAYCDPEIVRTAPHNQADPQARLHGRRRSRSLGDDVAGLPSGSTRRARRGSADTWARELRSSARARSASAGRSRSAGADSTSRCTISTSSSSAGRMHDVAARLADLESFDLLDEPADTILARVAAVHDLGAAVAGADHVQECAPETVELKRQLLASSMP